MHTRYTNNVEFVFLGEKTYSKGIGDLYQADLVDLSNISRYNDSFRYLLTVIDVFSKMACCGTG